MNRALKRKLEADAFYTQKTNIYSDSRVLDALLTLISHKVRSCRRPLVSVCDGSGPEVIDALTVEGEGEGEGGVERAGLFMMMKMTWG